MKSKYLCLATVFLLTACGHNHQQPAPSAISASEAVTTAQSISGESETTLPSSETLPADISSSETTAEQPPLSEDLVLESSEPESSDRSPSQSFFGIYSITGQQASAPFTAMSPEEIEQMAGTMLKYESDSFQSNEIQISLSQESFQTQMIPTDQLQADYGIAPADLGIPEATSEILSVTVDTNAVAPGTYFLVIDDNTLLIPQDGVFFRAERVIH